MHVRRCTGRLAHTSLVHRLDVAEAVARRARTMVGDLERRDEGLSRTPCWARSSVASARASHAA